MANGEVTTNELMEFLQENMATKEDLHELRKEVATDMGKLKLDILDSMDDKLTDLKGDLIVLMRKEDHKVVELIHVLQGKGMLSDEEVQRLLVLEPFPQTHA